MTEEVFVQWATFWSRDRTQAEWLFEEVLARGRGHSLFAPRAGKKSLFTLWLCAQLATGADPVVVVYLDYENGEDDLYERLQDMGHGADTDLSRLHYAVLPDLDDLDTAAGAGELLSLLERVVASWPDHHLLVVFDTMSRAVSGEENSADTVRRFYSFTAMRLKQAGATWLRLDHVGKDARKGQRGSSSKGDDVDVVWRMAQTESGITLHRDKGRMSWVPEKVTFAITQDPLTFRKVAGDWPAGTVATAQLLDEFELPIGVSTRVAAASLRAAGEGRRMELVTAALRWRRERESEPEMTEISVSGFAGNTFEQAAGNDNGNRRETGRETPPETPGNTHPGHPVSMRHPLGDAVTEPPPTAATIQRRLAAAGIPSEFIEEPNR